MLHKDPFIVAQDTFRLIQELQTLPELKNFVLVGGTSLALQMGHRNSIYIDLFSQQDFTVDEITKALEKKHLFTTTFARNNTILGVLDDIDSIFYTFLKFSHNLICSHSIAPNNNFYLPTKKQY